MSSGLIVLIFIVALILIVGYVVAVILRKRNEALLAALEERKEKLYNLPVNDEVEAVKNMHLIGQSQVAFREWNQKWVDLSLNSFADIENNLFEAEGYNNSFRFMKAKQAIDNIESQIQLIDEDIKAIRQALSDLEEQEQKNSGRVVHALDMFEELQKEVTSDPDRYGSALPEIEKQIGNIQSEFSQFVTLNSSGDPVEAAEILDTAENHIVALKQIVERVPEIVTALQSKLPDQLEDLESGYRKLLESGYHFTETDIESRFQQLHASLKNNMANVSALELDNAIYENEQIQEEIDALYHIFTREIESQKVVKKLVKQLPGYLKHAKDNNSNLAAEVERLSKTFVLNESFSQQLKELEAEPRTLIFYESTHRLLESLEDMVTVWGEGRYVVLARELTKTWETIHGAPVGELLAWVKEDENRRKGEMVLIVEGHKAEEDALPADALRTLALLQSELPLKKAAALAAEIHGVKKNALYKYALEQQGE